MTWFRPCIEENADFGIKNTTKRLKEPSMRVDLLRVFLFQTKYHLYR